MIEFHNTNIDGLLTWFKDITSLSNNNPLESSPNLCNKIFARGFANTLEENEGITVIVDDKKYFIHKRSGDIVISHVVDMDNVKDGQKIFVNDVIK